MEPVMDIPMETIRHFIEFNKKNINYPFEPNENGVIMYTRQTERIKENLREDLRYFKILRNAFLRADRSFPLVGDAVRLPDGSVQFVCRRFNFEMDTADVKEDDYFKFMLWRTGFDFHGEPDKINLNVRKFKLTTNAALLPLSFAHQNKIYKGNEVFAKIYVPIWELV